MKLFVGLDSSTQSLSAVALDFEGQRVIFEHQVNFDERLPEYGTRNGVLPHEDPRVAHSSPLLWAAALDLLWADLRAQGQPLEHIAALSGSGQQHGSVYLRAEATAALANLDPGRSLAEQIQPVLSRPTSPIWMDSSTSQQCQEIMEALGGPAATAELTGSCAFERFTGPQIRKFYQTDPVGYRATDRIHLVSSYMASLLAGKHAPIDRGDGAGMNLMDIRRCDWAPAALAATAPELGEKLPPIVPSDTVVGPLSPYFVEKYGLSPTALVLAWSGDNPNSLVGVGLIRPGRICISLGTSDTYFGYMPEPNVDPAGEGHVFGSPTGGYMSLICFKNGSLAREAVRDAYGMTWEDFSAALRRTPPGNRGAIMLPYFAPEIVPRVLEPRVYRYGLEESDGPANVRAVVEAQMMSMVLHSRWMGVTTDTIYATGGAAANRDLLTVMANVHDATVYQFEVGNSAALGAALRAAHGYYKAQGQEIPWEEVVAGFTQPVAGSQIRPDPAQAALYRELIEVYRRCEDHALRGGPDPEPVRTAFASRYRGD